MGVTSGEVQFLRSGPGGEGIWLSGRTEKRSAGGANQGSESASEPNRFFTGKRPDREEVCRKVPHVQ